MNFSLSPFLNAFLPMIEKEVFPMLEADGLAKWNSTYLPMATAFAKSIPAGKGQEELLILVNALDQIVKFEATRTIA